MKTAKKPLSILLLLCYIVIAIMPTFAAEIQPQSQGTTYARTFLTINQSGLASCTIDVDARQSSFRIEETMTLYRIKDSNYIQLKSWSKADVQTLSSSGNYYVTKGYDYQIIAVITIKRLDGSFVETISTTSDICHY